MPTSTVFLLLLWSCIQNKSGGPQKRRRVVRSVWCQVVSPNPPPIHGWWSIAGRQPLYMIGCRSVTHNKLSRFKLFLTHLAAFFASSCSGSNCCSQNGQASFKWVRKPAFWPDHLIWSEYSLSLCWAEGFCETCADYERPSLTAEMTTASALSTGRAGRAAPAWWTCSSWEGLALTSWTVETTHHCTWPPATDIVTLWER